MKKRKGFVTYSSLSLAMLVINFQAPIVPTTPNPIKNNAQVVNPVKLINIIKSSIILISLIIGLVFFAYLKRKGFV